MILNFCVIFFVELGVFVQAYSPSNWHTTLELDAFHSQPNKSMVVATLPLRLSLCKLASLATGTIKKDLMTALDYKSDKKVKSCFSQVHGMLNKLQQTDLILLNKIYVNYSDEIDTKFSANSSGTFGVDVERIGFNLPRTAMNFINNGIASATYRRIRDVIDIADITDRTKMILMTAAYFKATWESPFEIKRTKYRKFYGLHNKVTEIPMMIQDDSFLQYEDRNYKMLTTKLRSSGASFTIVVPAIGRGLAGFLSQLKDSPNLLQGPREAMTRRPTRLVLPRFKIKTALDYTEIFRNSTLKEILNSNSRGLNGVLREQSRNGSTMFVNKIKQKNFLEVDEFGVSRQMNSVPDFMTEAPRISMSITEFAADRPFYFSFDLEEFVPKADHLSSRYHQLFCGVFYGPE